MNVSKPKLHPAQPSIPVPAGSLMLVHFVEQQLEGWTFERAHWPLHITLIPWFRVEDDEAVNRALSRLAGETDSFDLVVGKQMMLGPDRNVPANIITNQAPARDIHERLMAVLAHADIAYHEQGYVGDKYLAHINRHLADGRHSSEGEEILVNDFHSVRLVDHTTCRVENRFELKAI